MTSPLSRPFGLALLLALLVALVIATQRTRNTESDPLGTLLVSESLVERGTLKLDAYGADYLKTFGFRVHEKNGHFYNYFPLGTALLSTPAVAVAHAAGWRMTQDEAPLQLILATGAAWLILYLLYKTARLYLGPRQSLLLAGLCWFGSSLASTVGTGLWSHDFTFVFSSAALYWAVRNPPWALVWRALAIGSALFLAYLCRPTLALLAPCLLLYCFCCRDRWLALLAGTVLLAWLVLFAGFSQLEYGQWLPDYYLPKRLEDGDFATALQGNLISPARGLLVYSPFLLVSLAGSLGRLGQGRDALGLGLLTLAWPLAHLVSISHFPHWWAGWSYGARLMVDALPGLFLGLFSLLGSLRHGRRPVWAAVAVGGLVGIFFNAVQGLYNPYSKRWNAEPNIDRYPEYIFDWRHPPFLHSERQHVHRLDAFRAKTLPPFEAAVDIPYDSPAAAFDHFHFVEDGFRWSDGREARLSFVLGRQALAGEARLTAMVLDRQRLTLLLNDQPVYAGELPGGEQALAFSVPPGVLREGLNSLVLRLPDAHAPNSADTRILALALRRFSLR